jgi:hypothetical protein
MATILKRLATIVCDKGDITYSTVGDSPPDASSLSPKSDTSAIDMMGLDWALGS